MARKPSPGAGKKKAGASGRPARKSAARSPKSAKSGPPKPETVFDGVGVAPGIAIGPAHVRESGAIPVPEYVIEPGQTGDEIARFHAAVEAASKQIRKLKTKATGLRGAAGDDLGVLLDAHLQMLSGSRLVRGAERRIADKRQNAEAALQAETSEVAEAFEAMEDNYLAARGQDIRDVARRILRHLTHTPFPSSGSLPVGSVVIAEELSPADTALLDPNAIEGFVTVLGGAQSHTAIMARSLDLPAVLGAAGLLEGTGALESGDMVVVDGDGGRVIVSPSAETLADYRNRQKRQIADTKRLGRLRSLPAETSDGEHVVLQANMELPREAPAIAETGAEGVGLLRSEFLYMNRQDLPDADEQYRAFSEIVEALDGKPLTIRTLDVGGDKIAWSLVDPGAEAPNPALGLRAIRLSLKEKPLLETQLEAILRAGAHGPVRILLPMISNTGEVRQVRKAVQRVATRLRRKNVKIADPLPPLGVMIEVPGAALAADALARDCDFFAIGTNDLTMYTLAIDRGDEQVAHLYNPLHPAVLRLLQFTTEAALRARIPVCLCGEMAADPRYTALLIGLGIRDLSMAPTAVPLIKRRIRELEMLAATRRAALIMDQSDSGRIAALLDDFNALA